MTKKRVVEMLKPHLPQGFKIIDIDVDTVGGQGYASVIVISPNHLPYRYVVWEDGDIFFSSLITDNLELLVDGGEDND